MYFNPPPVSVTVAVAMKTPFAGSVSAEDILSMQKATD